jgi:hypothetical protein
VGQHERAGAHRAGVGLDIEAVGALRGVEHLAVAHLDVREGRQLIAAGQAQVGRRHGLREQPADALGGRVGRAARVDDQHALSRAAEHERSAQAGGPSADDHRVEAGPADAVTVVGVPTAAGRGGGVVSGACVHLCL